MIIADDVLNFWSTAIWRASLQGGVAALVVWVICRWAPAMPARFQCWLWRLVLLKFLIAAVLSARIELPLLPAGNTEVPVAIPSTSTAAVFIGGASSADGNLSSRISPRWVPFSIWVVVAIFQLTHIWWTSRAARRLRKHGQTIEIALLQEQRAQLCKSLKLRSPPQLLEIAGEGSPFVSGLVRPAIVFPAATLARLDASELAVVMAHETAHIRRADLAWSAIGAVVQALFFFHPLAWLCQKRMRLSQEIAADELAISFQKYDTFSYASAILSVVSKLGPVPSMPAMSVGIVGSQHSLQQRFIAMRFMMPLSIRCGVVYGLLLTIFTLVCVAPWVPVAAQAPSKDSVNAKSQERAAVAQVEKAIGTTPDKPLETSPRKTPAAATQKVKTERGRFISFENGVLKLQTNSGATVENSVPVNAKIVVWNEAESVFKTADSVEILGKQKAGTWTVVQVGEDGTLVRVGSRKGKTIGTYVSFIDGRLLMLGKNLGESFTKKYGNNVRFNRFRDDVPLYESVDGGEYQLIGMANKVLPNVKEGTVVTVHGEGDDNITMVQIGVPKTP